MREPAGIPTGGQFSAGPRDESEVSLTPAASTQEIEAAATRTQKATERQEKVSRKVVDHQYSQAAQAILAQQPRATVATFFEDNYNPGVWRAQRAGLSNYQMVFLDEQVTFEIPRTSPVSRDYAMLSSAIKRDADQGEGTRISKESISLDVHLVPSAPAPKDGEYEKAAAAQFKALATLLEADFADPYPNAKMISFIKGPQGTLIGDLLDADGKVIPDGRWDASERHAGVESSDSEALSMLDLDAAEKAGALERSGKFYTLDLRTVKSPRNAPAQTEQLF